MARLKKVVTTSDDILTVYLDMAARATEDAAYSKTETANMADLARSAKTSNSENNFNMSRIASESHIDARFRNLQKNKSELYLIKSYSFIDRTHSSVAKKIGQRSSNDNSRHKRNIDALLLDVGNSDATQKTRKNTKNNKLNDAKSKKSKSTNDDSDSLEDLGVLLRQQPVILEGDDMDAAPLQNTNRPKSMPNSVTRAVRVQPTLTSAATTTLDVTAPPAATSARVKRENFLRHSLQSIRRSFSAHKKFASFSGHSSCSSSNNNTNKKTSFNNTRKVLAKSVSSSNSHSSNSSCSAASAGSVSKLDATEHQNGCNENNDNNGKDKAEKQQKCSKGKGGNAVMWHGNNVDNGADVDVGADNDGRAVVIMLNGNCANVNGGIALQLSQREAPTLDGHGANPNQSVSTFAATPSDNSSMAPLQSHTEAQSVTTLNLLDIGDSGGSTTTVRHQLSQQKLDKYQQERERERLQSQHHRQASGTNSCPSDSFSAANSESSTQSLANNGHSKDDLRSLKHCSSTLNTLEPGISTTSIRSLSPTSRKSGRSNSNSNSSNTAKHEQSTAAATAAAAATASSEKEKKRKEVSSSRVKKFHRHFSQVSKDEKLINYFSCALVSDILLQGHLYITDKHFAFYSNVFGYVTKVVIPTSSVTKISKEKTAKIIPNAVGVATADERHVFGSFISRESAFRLMCSVCPPLAPAELLPKAPADVEISEEYSIEDDSSCSISGNESPPQALAAAAAAAGLTIDDANGGMLLRRAGGNSNSNSIAIHKLKHSSVPPVAANSNLAAHYNAGIRASAPPSSRFTCSDNNKSTSTSDVLAAFTSTATKISADATPILSSSADAAAVAASLTMIVAGTASSTTSSSSSPSPSTSSSPPTTVMIAPKSAAQNAMESFKTLSQTALLRLKFPTELHVVYFGVMLTMVLALLSFFLLYRILDIEAKTTTYRTPIDFSLRTSGNDEIFAEALRWQKELQAKNTEEAQSILTKNLEQIAKVRRSLETLSMLIQHRSSAYSNGDDSD